MPHSHANNIGREPLGVGIVGCGQITETIHLPAMLGLRGHIEPVAVADMDEHRRRRVAGMFGIAQSFSSLESMLRTCNRIDAVAVCTPAQFHADAMIAALRAGKHVFVEKPLSLSLDDADRIATEAEAHPELRVAVGFNQRHHRLVVRARRMVADGFLGELRLIRTFWTSGRRNHPDSNAWRSRRQSGGGVLLELAVHHFDLIRFLTGLEIRDVFAQSRHDQGDDETAVMNLRLSDDATATCSFSERSVDAHEIELIGTRGRIAFSMYRFDSFDCGSRAGRLSRTLKDLSRIWPIMRRGGDFRESYRQQWLAFAGTAGYNHSPTATVADGRESLRVALSAIASANRGVPVAVGESERQPESALPAVRAPQPLESVVSEEPDQPDLTAIIGTRGSFESIRRTVRHLRVQTIQNKIELIIVCARLSELNLDEKEISGFWGHQVLEIGPFESVARSNAAGARVARAPIIVFNEDHSFPDPNWAQSLLIAHRGPYAAVGPAVHNANPATVVSRADFLIGYGRWAEPVKPGEMPFLMGHNCAYKRDVLLAYGDRLEETLEAETILHWELTSSGQRLYIDPSARLAHTNFAHFGRWTIVQYQVGRLFGGERSAKWPLWKRAFYACASPLIPLVRLKRVLGYSRRINGSRWLDPKLVLALAWALTLDGIGQFCGYVAGVGNSAKNAHEFDRMPHITEEDRRQLDAGTPASL